LRELQCLWYPEKVQILEYTNGTRVEQFAAWTNSVRENMYGNTDGGSVVRDVKLRAGREARILDCFSDKHCSCLEWLDNEQRWSVRLIEDGPKTLVEEDLLEVLNDFIIKIPASFGVSERDVEGVEVQLLGNGQLDGPGLPPSSIKFDGSSIVARPSPCHPGGQAWRKAGYWRLDFVTKVLMAIAVVGLGSVFAAVVLPPGVVSEASARLPLKAVFLVDGSSSVTQQQWTTAMRANKQFISDFEDVGGCVQLRARQAQLWLRPVLV